MPNKIIIIVGVEDSRLICKPLAAFDVDTEEALSLAAAWIKTNIPKTKNSTRIYAFDALEGDFEYLNAPEETDEQDEQDEQDENSNEEGAMPSCPAWDPAKKTCAWGRMDTPADYVPDEDDELGMYKPSDLLFAVLPNDIYVPRVPFTVYLTTVETWEKHGHQDDNIHGYKLDEEVFEKTRLHSEELTESTFEYVCDEDTDITEVYEDLLEAGFGFRQDFQDFILHSNKQDE